MARISLQIDDAIKIRLSRHEGAPAMREPLLLCIYFTPSGSGWPGRYARAREITMKEEIIQKPGRTAIFLHAHWREGVVKTKEINWFIAHPGLRGKKECMHTVCRHSFHSLESRIIMNFSRSLISTIKHTALREKAPLVTDYFPNTWKACTERK